MSFSRIWPSFLAILLTFIFCNANDDDITNDCTPTWTQWSIWSSCINNVMTRIRGCTCDSTASIEDITSNTDTDTTAPAITAFSPATSPPLDNDGIVLNPTRCSYSEQKLDFVQTLLCDNVSSLEDTFNLTLSILLPGEGGSGAAVKGEISCSWRWMRWKSCTKACGGGVTWRQRQCICEESDTGEQVVGECEADPLPANETVPCNDHQCGFVKAHNKVYWADQHRSFLLAQREFNFTEEWPFPNPHFNCTLGEDPAHLKSLLTFTDLLDEDITINTPNLEWTLLAKEYVAAMLNLDNGYVPSSLDGLTAIADAEQLLRYCDGYNSSQFASVLVAKEKLSRLNNNIGGIADVDAFLGEIEVGGGGGGGGGAGEGGAAEVTAEMLGEEKTPSKVVYVTIVTAVVVGGVMLVVAVVVMVVRRRRVVEYNAGETYENDGSEESESQEEALVPPTPTALNVPRITERGMRIGGGSGEGEGGSGGGAGGGGGGGGGSGSGESGKRDTDEDDSFDSSYSK